MEINLCVFFIISICKNVYNMYLIDTYKNTPVVFGQVF